MIGSAFTIRNASDYDDMFIASKADTEEQIASATYIYAELSKYINEIVGTNDDNNWSLQKEHK